MSKTITLLGSTGSIGITALKVIKFLKGEFRVLGLSCRRNIALLEEQIREFSPAFVAVESLEAAGGEHFRSLKKKYPGTVFYEGDGGVREVAAKPVDILLSAIVGAAGLRPSLEAIGSAKRIALANKETLVMAGDLFTKRVRERGTELIPVDSEHSAIFLLLRNMDPGDVARVILTASGGSLRGISLDRFGEVTPQMALNHPTWSMGSKITIDSATMMNKGLEVIEAHHLFGLDYDMIDVIIHPESVIHSMVESIDGALYAHMSVADMSFPILCALKYPERVRNDFGRLDLEKLGSLNFCACEKERYPALDLSYSAGKCGGTMPAVLNGANEVAVEAFLNERIKFSDIVRIVELTMERHAPVGDPTLDDIMNADAESREISSSLITR